ncbi:MAG: hypothetical protein Unbinned6224contig1001_9 [Prokaryotic dsDNA virus sp.]|nr:MAG: hypothetical protein Unbinned6224contig1001_9 [Prokaryotic dsDNA virus sp.]|tara:strand:- start:4944 stop:5429 length:486 start_codon:yes stop_codon:yes gene_type:complete
MDIKTYEAVIKHFRRKGDEQAKSKRIEYTESRGDEDVLANFKATAKDIKIEPLHVLYTFMKKHWSSIINYINTGKEYSTESVLGRIMDLIQYLELTYATILEKTLSEEEIQAIVNCPEQKTFEENEKQLEMENSLNMITKNESDVPEDRAFIRGNLGDPEC